MRRKRNRSNCREECELSLCDKRRPTVIAEFSKFNLPKLTFFASSLLQPKLAHSERRQTQCAAGQTASHKRVARRSQTETVRIHEGSKYLQENTSETNRAGRFGLHFRFIANFELLDRCRLTMSKFCSNRAFFSWSNGRWPFDAERPMWNW